MIPERPRYYILDADGEPVPCDDVEAFGRWFQNLDNRVIAKDRDEGPGAEPVEVSTVFLGLDHQWGNGPPILFETLVFGGPLDGEMLRYATRAEAIDGHARVCRWVRIGRRQP